MAMLQLGPQPRVGSSQARGTAAPSAVSPRREVESRSARASSSSRAALLPAAQATESGATPSWSLALAAAPWSSSSRIASSWPHCAGRHGQLGACMWHTHGARMWHTHGSGMPSARYAHGSVHASVHDSVYGMCLRSMVERRSAVGVRSADESVQGGTREQDSEQLGVARARSEMQRRAAARGVTDCHIDTCHSRKSRPWHQGTPQLVWQGRRTLLDERFDAESVSKVGSDQKLFGVHTWEVVVLHSAARQRRRLRQRERRTSSPLSRTSLGRQPADTSLNCELEAFGKELDTALLHRLEPGEV